MTKKTSPNSEAIRLTQLWQEHGPNTYPLDIAGLIDGAIQRSGFRGSLKTRKRRFSSFEGCLVRAKNTDRWTILLNEKVRNKRRLRFTHAHELGHFMCHREMRDRFVDDEESLNDFHDAIETEANVFASWLLMPANLLRNEFARDRWTTDTLRKIGNRFECSLQASALRYVELSSKPTAFVVSRDGIILWACKSDTAPFMSSYCFGDPLPKGSPALTASNSGVCSGAPERSEYSWNEFQQSTETQYFDTSGHGYQYTCIEFD